MVKIPDNIKKIIDRYISLLKKNNISVENAYLFGSYAKGYNNEWSDIDLAIISGSFEGIRIKDRDKIRRITLSVSSNLEILPFFIRKSFGKRNNGNRYKISLIDKTMLPNNLLKQIRYLHSAFSRGEIKKILN